MHPDQIHRLLQEAVKHHREGRLASAVPLYRRVRAAQPRCFEAVHMLGLIALQQDRPAEAIGLLSLAHRLSPRSSLCAMRLGLAFNAAGQQAEAERHLRLAIELEPQLAAAWDNLAFCLKTQDRLAEATGCHERSLALRPDSAFGWYNFGLTLALRGRHAEALGCHERALAVDPGYALGHFGRAQTLQHLHRIPEAIEAYGRHLELDPANLEARSFRLMALQYADGWPRRRLYEEHLAFGRAVSVFPVPDFPNPPEPERPLRVAVFSPDLRAHSCAFFLEPLLRHLDPAAFTIHLYHDHFREDATSARLKSRAKVWRNFVGQPAAAVETAVRADAPDILIDLAGHTGMGNRLPLFARHLAPVQVTYLGYPDTTGMAGISHRLTDAIADPPGEADAFATEQLVRFARTAWSYQPPEFAPEPGPPPSAGGRPVTFGCFNNPAKITDALLGVWARLLAAVPGSRLLLKGAGLGADDIRARYRDRFAAAGLPAEQVEMVERTDGACEHLELYGRVDVALDTFPYHGTTTTCEALWMGVPVVTWQGDRHASRVGASLLHAAGHPEWIAPTAEDYIRLAAGLAADSAGRASWRTGLRDDLRRGPLLDHAGQAEKFGAALRACWSEWCAKRVTEPASA